MQVNFYGQQYDFVMSDAHYALLRGGIGSGKSLGGAGRGLAAALGYVGTTRIQTPNVGVVTAPTYGMLRDASLRTFLELAGDLVASVTKSPPINVRLKNGSEVLFRSADLPDNLRGPNLAWWWGDEAAYYRRDVWRVMIGRLRQFGRRGYAWLTTTPKGRNWLYQIFEKYLSGAGDASYAVYQLITKDNPFIEEEFYTSLSQEYEGDFAKQELDGDFITSEGLIYAGFRRELHVVHDVPASFSYYVAGVDWGFVNPGVMLIAGVDGDGRSWIIHEEYHRRLQIDEWMTLGKGLNERYLPNGWWADPSEPSYIRKLEAVGCKAESANNEVLPGIQRVQGLIQRQADGKPRLLIGAWCANTIAEMEQYEWQRGRDGLQEQPVKANDHAMDALRYLVAAGKQRKRAVAQAREY